MSVWDEIAGRLREMMHEVAEARTPAPSRGKVKSVDPLIITGVDDGLDLEEGDPDVEVVHRVKADAEVGDAVVIHQDEDGGFLAHGLLKEEE